MCALTDKQDQACSQKNGVLRYQHGFNNIQSELNASEEGSTITLKLPLSDKHIYRPQSSFHKKKLNKKTENHNFNRPAHWNCQL